MTTAAQPGHAPSLASPAVFGRPWFSRGVTRLAAIARRRFGQSLAQRFVMMSLALLALIQLLSFLAIDDSMRRHARAALPEQLTMGSRTLESMMQWRSEKLVEGARLLAADYGFRSAVQSNDRDTIASVLANHGARIGATEVALLATDFSLVATADGTHSRYRVTWSSVERLAERAAQAGAATDIAIVDGMPRQRALVPLKAPMLVGWVLMYFPLPASISDDLYKLSAVDLTVLSRPRADVPFAVAFTHVEPTQAQALAQHAWVDPRDVLRAGTASPDDVLIGPEEFIVQPVWLTPLGDAAGTPEVVALLSVSIHKAMRPPRDLQIAWLLTTLLGFLAFAIGSAYTARRVTTPLKALALAAERLGSGDHNTPVRGAWRRDEVGELALAFEQMRVSIAATQEQVVQSEKMASIGQLAAGVAHEINNPIGFVFSNFGTLEDYLARLFKMLAAYQQEESALSGTPAALRLQSLREDIELDYLREDIPALMSESKDGIQRVRKIVQDLKDFSHVDARQQWESVDLHAGLDSTLNIVNNEIKYKADVAREYGVLPEVECLPSELNQVFMNLLVNAAHSIGEQRGTITLRTGTAGPEVWVEVADNGSGIAPESLKRIFDPFFTTKPVGKGTGLGLSLSYGIVKKHGGRIEVSSELGRGTRFRVFVPARRPVAPSALVPL
jgi:signal transduction histidine kinase